MQPLSITLLSKFKNSDIIEEQEANPTINIIYWKNLPKIQMVIRLI